jgi:SRSO17 transposase
MEKLRVSNDWPRHAFQIGNRENCGDRKWPALLFVEAPEFATKPARPLAMIERAIAARVPFSFVAAVATTVVSLGRELL